jgi:hypothetical protein
MTRELKEQTNDLLSYIREDAQGYILFQSLRDLCIHGGKLFPVEYFFKKSLVTDLLPVVISDRGAHRTVWQNRPCLEHLCLPRRLSNRCNDVTV